MAAAKIIVVEKNEGEKIPYEVSGTKIVFGDDELMVNCKSRERDYEVTLDVCKDTADGLTVGVNTEAREYVAQVTIPAREYKFVDTGEKDEKRQLDYRTCAVAVRYEEMHVDIMGVGLRS